MEVIEAIHQRRSVRNYTEELVSKSEIMQLLRAATWAPSAVNEQPWAFAVVRGRKQLERYSERAKNFMLQHLPQSLSLHWRSDQLAHPDYNVFHHAGTLIVIYAKPGRFETVEDCFMAGQNLLLAAQALGLGTCPVGFARPWLNESAVKLELGIPSNYQAALPVVVGRPASPTQPPPRKEPEIVSWGEDPEETNLVPCS